MAQHENVPCSPYLRKERRGLREACKQISKTHGQMRPPCGACPLTDLCGPAMPLKWAARALQTRAILVDLRDQAVRERTANAA